MARNNITISLPREYLEALDRLSKDSESVGQCAKRLLLEVLDGDRSQPSEDRLTFLEERLEKLESAIAKTGQPAIMIQKQPLPLVVEIQRTHEEVAQDWGKTLATVKRWAKDPNKWPEGWLWDGDKNFWVKEV